MLQLIGWIGAIFLAVCAIPQAWKSFREKNSVGISPIFLFLWGVGDFFGMLYVILRGDAPLIFNYVLNVFCILIITFYKIWPSKESVREV